MASLTQAVFVVPALCTVAHERGFLAARGLEVSTISVTSSQSQLSDLAEGRAEIAITATDNLLAWNTAGGDIALIAQVESVTPLALLLRPGLESLDDLDVVRLAVDAPTNGFAVVAYSMMAASGRRYEVIEVGGVSERFDALDVGTVDATLVSAPLDEIGELRGMRVVMRVEQVVPAYPGLGVVATRATICHRLDRLAAYLGGLDDALTWMHANADELAELLSGSGFGPAAVRSVLSTMPSTLAPDPASLDTLARLREQVDMVISGAPEPRDLVDVRALKAAGLVPIR